MKPNRSTVTTFLALRSEVSLPDEVITLLESAMLHGYELALRDVCNERGAPIPYSVAEPKRRRTKRGGDV